jgi:multiple sugar transport system permease protein
MKLPILKGQAVGRNLSVLHGRSFLKRLFLVTTQLIISAFQVFDQAYMLTQGGPGNSTITLVYYIYNKGFGGFGNGLCFCTFLFYCFLLIFVFFFSEYEVYE